MARVEKTVFISYRRKDISWALAVYQYLTSQKYDVFFDYTSIPSGDFEQIIVSNIRARAHFILILTPTALDRCSQPGDWLRREIETAIDEKRNIVPLFFDGFSFGSSSVAEKLTGKLGAINRYNGLDIPSGYFMEAMERLRLRYLNVPLNAVIHPIPTEVRKAVREQHAAADKALVQKSQDIKRLIKPAKFPKPNFSPFGIAAGVLIIAVLGILGIYWLNKNTLTEDMPTSTYHLPISSITSSPTRAASTQNVLPTQTSDFPAKTKTPTRTIPTNTMLPPTLTSVPTLIIGSTMVSSKDGMLMVYVPAGEFQMGSKDGADDEKPVHTVYLDAFWIDQTEVTNAMYAKCVQAGQCVTSGLINSYTRERYYGNPEFDDYPAVSIFWNQASAYCEWAGRRLPTEAEWEKTASWDDETKIKYVYPWGNIFNGSHVNFCDVNCTLDWAQGSADDGFADTAPINSFLSGTSPYSALNLVGNVWEWVADWYDKYYYSISPLSNPLGPSSGSAHVLRGGSWAETSTKVRSTTRWWKSPSDSGLDVGFRCAMSASE
jgi:formylglycine-generating enzyme required for sulfatase activity